MRPWAPDDEPADRLRGAAPIADGVRLAADGDALWVTADVATQGPRGLLDAVDRVRWLTSREVLVAAGLKEGWRLEDVVWARASGGGAEAAAFLARRLPPGAAIDVADGSGPVRLEVVVARRGSLPTSQRPVYTRGADGRIAVEAFELHVVEHCNLRCAACCNMSPWLDFKVSPVEEIAVQCRVMAEHLDVEVFKIMGGEPLLHPDITRVLRAVRASGIGRVVRLFTNGLRLHQMDDAFFDALDHLTISTYSSAPVPARTLDAVRERSLRHGFVLNVKPVAEFSRVMHDRRHADDATRRAVWEDCWLRHRCLVVREGRFFACTRAAYSREQHRKIALTDPLDDPDAAWEAEGVALDHPNLGEALLAHLNRAEPFSACWHCLGSAGPVAPHRQLTPAAIRSRRLDP
jgi:hypothetical protein